MNLFEYHGFLRLWDDDQGRRWAKSAKDLDLGKSYVFLVYNHINYYHFYVQYFAL
jgi:hypothetical protein